MCGFFFCTREKYKVNINKLNKLSQIISHRGPDSSDLYSDNYVFLKFFRLSIRDTTNLGMQPMFDNSKRYILVFNGEIYNSEELKKKLKYKNFKSNSDTEILLYLLIENGLEILKKIEGMFSFILYDKKEKIFFFGRDRLGIKPLYYTKYRNEYFFCSEIKPLALLKKNELNEKAVADFFFKSSMDHEDTTFFKDVISLEAGTCGYIQKNKLIKKKYWSLEEVVKKKYQSFFDEKNNLKTIFNDSIKKHLISDRKIGLFLSGGTDSRGILNSILKHPPSSLRGFETFTYGFQNSSDIDEIKEVKKITKSLKIKSNFLIIKPDEIEKNFQSLTTTLESPFTSIRIFAVKKLYDLAKKKNFSVILEGDGGDEIFGGYDYNFLPFAKDKFKNRNNKIISILNFLKKFVKIKNKDNYYLLNLILSSTFQFASTSDGMISVNSNMFSYDFLRKYIYEDFYNYKKIKKFNNLQNSQYKDICFIKLPRSLKYKDRISMSQGIEARLPLLHHPFVEEGFFMPNHYKFNNFETRFIFKNMVGDKKSKINNYSLTKKTIADPQKIWLQKNLKNFFLDNLNSYHFRNLEFFDHKQIKKEYELFCVNKSSETSFIFFQILSFIQFKKAFKNYYVN